MTTASPESVIAGGSFRPAGALLGVHLHEAHQQLPLAGPRIVDRLGDDVDPLGLSVDDQVDGRVANGCRVRERFLKDPRHHRTHRVGQELDENREWVSVPLA